MSTSELASLDDPTFRRELLTVASFLAGYGSSTRNSYATDLRLFADWRRDYGLSLFDIERSHRQRTDQRADLPRLVWAAGGLSRR